MYKSFCHEREYLKKNLKSVTLISKFPLSPFSPQIILQDNVKDLQVIQHRNSRFNGPVFLTTMLHVNYLFIYTFM